MQQGGISYVKKKSILIMLLLIIPVVVGQTAFTKDDYIQLTKSNDIKNIEFLLTNPENNSLSYSELQFKTVDMTTARSPLDMNVKVLAGGLERITPYTVEKIDENIYSTVFTNETQTIKATSVIDLNKQYLNVTFEENNSFLVDKKTVVSFNPIRNTYEIWRTSMQIVGNKTVTKKFLLDKKSFLLPAFNSKKISVEIIPQIKYRYYNNSWGYSLFYNPWYNTSFKNRINITFNVSWNTENLTNFPILVILNSSNVDYNSIQNNGQDIRFTDSDETTLLPHEIELWNESGNSYVWVKVPQINAVSTTDFIQMYFNDSTASDGQDITNVWTNNYRGVYHFEDDPAGQINDSTTYSNHGNSNGTMSASSLIQTELGWGYNFTGTRSINISSTFQRVNNFSVDIWIYMIDGSPIAEVWTTQDINDFSTSFIFTSGWGTTPNDVWKMRSAGHTPSESSGFISDNFVTFATIVYDRSVGVDGTFYLYTNGDLNYTSTVSDGTGWLENHTTFYIGDLPNALDSSVPALLDEFRISNVTRSNNYINFTYQNLIGKTNIYSGIEVAPITDNCTYVSGNWNVNLADNCVISSLQDATGNKVFLTGLGTFTINSTGELRAKEIHFTPSSITGTNIFAIEIGGVLACLI